MKKISRILTVCTAIFITAAIPATAIAASPSYDYIEPFPEQSTEIRNPVSVVIISEESGTDSVTDENTETNGYFTKLSADDSTSVSEDDVLELARIIYAEMGSEWIPDEIQLYVGSVVLNRVASPDYPNNIHDVIYDRHYGVQYAPTVNGAINNTPDERTVANARYLLEHGSILPANVIYQGGCRQGSGIYYVYEDKYLPNEYFCYE